MNDLFNLNFPKALQAIEKATKEIGFTMASDYLTGSMLRTFAATKLSGNFLELGTGTGLATAWILDGMCSHSKLLTVDYDESLLNIAKQFLANDTRIELCLSDGGTVIESLLSSDQKFDFIFADAWAGKYNHLDEALALLKPGGIYVIDDLLPQPNWPEDHPPKVANLIQTLEQNQDFHITKLNWSTGLIIAVKISE
jgi:predicted O-methyltransferase YrrM